MEETYPKEKQSSRKFRAYKVAKFIETLFNRHGNFVASHPIKVMLCMILLSVFCGLGFLNVKMISRPEKLWIPQDTDFVKTLEWQNKNYPETIRTEIVLYEADNILKPAYIVQMFELKRKIDSIVVQDINGQNQTLNDLCYSVPALSEDLRPLIWDVSLEKIDWSLYASRTAYCSVYDIIPKSCLYLGLLDIWPPDETFIKSLTEEQIITDVNTANKSFTFSYPMNFTSFLGGVSLNSSGHIVEAKASLQVWNMKINRDKIDKIENQKLSVGMSSQVDKGLSNWEGSFLEIVLKERNKLPDGLSLWPHSYRSFEDVVEETIFGDVKFLIVGCVLLNVYVALCLGKFNLVQMRPLLTGLGFLSVLCAITLSFGVCAFLGVAYGPVHSILPLILFGLGVDDMFVVVRSFETVKKSHKEFNKMSLERRMGLVLSSSGVAITVTSLTDFLAFSIGSSTSLPALQSFCLYAAVGIISLYFLMITLFFACFTLDQKRLEAQRNGLFWFIKHENWTANKCSQFDVGSYLMGKYSEFLTIKYTKIFVIMLTALQTALSIWGTINLKQEFDIITFYPKSSYVYQILTKINQYFPHEGMRGSVYIENIDLPEELNKLQWLSQSLKENKFISKLDSWYQPFISYTIIHTGTNLEIEDVSREFFSEILGKFLFSPKGMKYQNYFYFNGSLECLEDAPEILAVKFHYVHRIINGRDDQLKAMDDVKSLVAGANFSGFSTFNSYSYINWEMNRYITMEFLQNLCLAMIAVFLMTSLLIFNLRSSFFVLFSVILTLLDVLALMTWWGLTLETVTCINLVLTVGLSVDYSAHVTLHFMKTNGSRNERVRITLIDVGPAVFNGAFSTFLSIAFLVTSDSYVFQSFYKIFFGVFIYGLYNGLVFLPVLLSLIGSPPYAKQANKSLYSDDDQSKNEQELNNWL
ncbi:UNVERIFIED_CONTAM: hypothetical protein RMT77_017979 [Armadillidium vulgare]